ncbi:MAG TPA: hypothetical protein PLH94_15210, partial [Fimbriimonadaceae bacterium]|nr:hypothetical protein [Fimbriimonadaceae bacterium]
SAGSAQVDPAESDPLPRRGGTTLHSGRLCPAPTGRVTKPRIAQTTRLWSPRSKTTVLRMCFALALG